MVLKMGHNKKNKAIEDFINSCLSGSYYEKLDIYGNKDIYMEFTNYNGNVEVEFIDNSREEPYEVRSYFICEFGDEKMIPGIMLMHETILDFVESQVLASRLFP